MTREAQIWTRRQLTAAYWVGRVLGADGTPRELARSSYPGLPIGGRADVVELLAAEQELIAVGLARVEEERLIPEPRLARACSADESPGRELLLGLLLEWAPPLWLVAAGGDGDQLRRELIPDGADRALASVIEDPDRREAFLLSRARKVNASEREAIGELGELAVVDACRAQLEELGESKFAAGVQRVSAISDELGYDVTAPRVDGSTRRLEVKTTRVAGDVAQVILTRTEAVVGAADSAWALVVVRLDQEDQATVLGWRSGRSLLDLLPANKDPRGRWETAALRLEVAALEVGLPRATPGDSGP